MENVLAYREKTGCKQYVFNNEREMREYFNKKWYMDEYIKFTVYDDNGVYKYDGGYIVGLFEVVDNEKDVN